MVAFKIENFGGEIPAVDERLLPDNAAAYARNTWLFSGRIEPTHSLVPLHTMASPASRSWFRLPKGSPRVDNMADSDWLEFENQNVRVHRSPVVGQDDDGRYYWADGVQPMYTTGTRIRNADPSLKLGIPAPSVAPAVVPAGGVSGFNKTVSYVYTWVSSYGEEGPPSPPTTVTGKLDDTYTVTMTAPGAGDTTGRVLATTRIYRSIVSAQGIATYFFVTEIPIGTLVFADNIFDAVVVLNEQLASLNWTAPPADLEGLVSMPNGMMAAWREDEVWFCEPYRPHAWPIQYVIGVESKVVGLGVHNQSVIILTEGQPYSATGVDPGVMTLAKLQPMEPCTSRLSIVSTPTGVVYSSPNGLIVITAAGDAVNQTAEIIHKDQWDKLINLSSVAATILQQGYFAYAIAEAGVFQTDAFQTDAFQQESTFGSRPGMYLSLQQSGRGVASLDPAPNIVYNLMTDIFNNETMILRDGVVYLLDLRKLEPFAKYVWRSKTFTMPYLMNLGAAKVFFMDALGTDLDPTVFRVYAGEHAELIEDGLPLRFEQDLTQSGQMFRLPSGYKASFYQFEVEGYRPISQIQVGQSPRDLRSV